MNYYIAEGAVQKGPFPPEQLVAQGLRPDSLVWREGMAQWTRADQVADLRSILGLGPVPAATTSAAGGTGTPNYYGSGPGYAPPPGYGAPPAAIGYSSGLQHLTPAEISNKKMAAGLCAIFIGSLGVHKFILGMNTAGIIMLLVTVLTCGFGGIVMHVISIIEGILYLTKSDQEFYELYMAQKKEWF